MAGGIAVHTLTRRGIRPLNDDKTLASKSQGIFGVFDGASSLDAYRSADGKTGAYIAARIAAKTFAKPGKNLRETAIAANNAIEAAHRQAGIDVTKNVNRFGTTASVVRVYDSRAELLQIGDSVILVVDKDGHVAVPLGYHDHDLEIMRHWKQLAEHGATNIRSIVLHDILKLRESANSAYGMLNGDRRLENFLKTTTVSLDEVATILLLSDGMYIPKADPDAEEDWAYSVQLYRTGGLDALYNAVREKEKSDPELVKYPRYKLHDDASAVAIDLAQ